MDVQHCSVHVKKVLVEGMIQVESVVSPIRLYVITAAHSVSQSPAAKIVTLASQANLSAALVETHLFPFLAIPL